jgi:hypothetical protein
MINHANESKPPGSVKPHRHLATVAKVITSFSPEPASPDLALLEPSAAIWSAIDYLTGACRAANITIPSNGLGACEATIIINEAQTSYKDKSLWNNFIKQSMI